ncbi:DUF3325 domain-containing protein [Mitsuaria sp. GD03876]|uniref:DUF3325 domain-containing protein n=1 Tax=Mitsuaria sp. GD03876 TaxID=2975399 RepID=UPI00244BB854|nr:DUF3325 domain-containing protein [Mitsuaria sp. GD03876]MDH0862935.1 DUF3325 domain-containing protein [Mitsuaria sp. GD03876]
MDLLHPMLCSFAAFAALCLATERHHEEALEHMPSPRRVRRLRTVALVAFLASWWTVIPRLDHGVAWAMWTAQLSVGAFTVVALATWWPRRLPAAAIAVGATALMLMPLTGPMPR